MQIKYEVDEKGTIHIDESKAPFDGQNYLIKTGAGWVEAYWLKDDPYEDHEGNKDNYGWMWCCLDATWSVEFDSINEWNYLPGQKPNHICRVCSKDMKSSENDGTCWIANCPFPYKKF